MTFSEWRTRARILAAARFAEGAILLSFGVRYGRAIIGVDELAVYSFEFTVAHGMSPREYQRREAGHPRPGAVRRGARISRPSG